jgi:predicted nucleic acid-binding protein
MRRGSRAELEQAADVLKSTVIIKLTPEMLERAADLEPSTLRSLDAIHLATALYLRSEGAVEISHFVVYDRRLAAAARDLGFSVASPGAA